MRVLLICLLFNLSKSHGQNDTLALWSFFLKNCNVHSGVYQIDYQYKSLTNPDTVVFKAQVYFSNNKANSEVKKIKFIVKIFNYTPFVNNVDTFFRFNYKTQCYESFLADSFNFDDLHGSSLWRVFNKLFITNQNNTFSNTNINTCNFNESADSRSVKSVNIVYDSTDNIRVRTKDITVKNENDILYYTEKNYLTYMDMFQFDSSSIQFRELPDAVIDDTISNLLKAFCRTMEFKDNKPIQTAPPIIDSSFSSFILPSIDDSLVDLSRIFSKYILLDFWHKSCIPCLKALPTINSLKDSFPETSLKVIGVNPYDNNIGEIKNVISKRHISYCILLDKGQNIANRFSINAYPTVLLIDTHTNKIIYRKEGFDEGKKNEIFLFLKKLLSTPN